MKLGPITISLAQPRQQTINPREGTIELGGLANAAFQQFLPEEYLPELQWPRSLTVYDRMRRSDGQVQAVLLALELPIRATRWFVKPASTDPRDIQIAEFVEENLFKGLRSPFDDVLRQALMLFPFGHAIAEIVYQVGPDGFLRWLDFAERPQKTIQLFVPDENGNLAIVQQRLSNRVVDLPAEKLLVFTHREEAGDPRGISVLRAAYKHWFIKDYVYKVMNIGIEQEYVGVPWAAVPNNLSDDLRAKLEDILTRLTQGQKAWFWLPNDIALNRYQSVRDQLNVLPYVEHQDMLIARSVLAQFINLGQGDVGSYALSEDHSNIFLMTLDATARYIETVFNRRAIPALVSANWNVDQFPELRHDPVGTRDGQQFVTALNTLINAGVISVDGELEAFMRDFLGLPEIDAGDGTVAGPQGNVQPDEGGAPPRSFADPGTRPHTSVLTFRRPLTVWEQRVNFGELNAAFSSADARLQLDGLKALGATLEPIWPILAKALRDGNMAALSLFQADSGPLAEMLLEFYLGIRHQAARDAAAEIGKPEPAIPDADKQTVAQQAQLFASTAVNRVCDSLRASCASAIARDKDPDAALADLKAQAEQTGKTTLAQQGAEQIPAQIDAGRRLAIQSAKVKLAQYSAILDQVVCPLCRSLDGQITTTDSAAFQRFRPPLHRNCRCVWVLIDPDEEDQPDVTWTSPPAVLVKQYGPLVA